MRTVRTAALLGLALALLTAAPAGAQEEPSTRQVDISFDVGAYDPALGDFPVTGVIVRGDGQEGQPVTVEVRDLDGALLWTGETTFEPPSVRIPLNPPVPVGRIGSAGIVQRIPEVAGVQFVPPEVFHSMEGGAGGSGQLALSMVLIVALIALLFRSPLPSASTQRWTR